MENMNDIIKTVNEVAQAASVLNIDLIAAKNLVDTGKEVLCSRKLQGALTKYQVLESTIVGLCEQIAKDNGDEVAAESDEKE